jgi:hypothetical protein
MKRVADLGRPLLSKGVWAASAFAGVTAAMPAQAQTSQSLDVYGYVAPRCWVSQASAQWGADGAMLAPRAICNQSAPLTQSNLRALNADGTPVVQMLPVTLSSQGHLPQQSARTAMEIVISPRL